MKNLKKPITIIPVKKPGPLSDQIYVQVFLNSHSIAKTNFTFSDIEVGDTLEVYIETEPSE